MPCNCGKNLFGNDKNILNANKIKEREKFIQKQKEATKNLIFSKSTNRRPARMKMCF
jgi:hypothetical protein|tara:strand:+ start:114 stop:284 length:171 start_codon:yes stop_codon:yes gene_type:complete